jgi:large subunit ribosomal protein L10e
MSKPYTRLEYIRGAPPSKVAKYVMGKVSGEFGYSVSLIAVTKGIVTSNALEAIRVTIGKRLSEEVGEKNFRLTIRVHPHHVIRENKMLAFAGADRIQKGMRLAFGRPIKRAALVNKGQAVLTVEVDEEGVGAAKEAVKIGSKKLSVQCRVKVEKL